MRTGYKIARRAWSHAGNAAVSPAAGPAFRLAGPGANRRSQAGIALITVVMIVALFSLMLAGFFLVVNGEQLMGASDRNHTQTYYGAEAGLENMSSALAAYFQKHTSPTLDELQQSLAQPADEPVLPGISYPAAGGDFPDGGYSITAAAAPANTPGCVTSGGLTSCPGTIGGTGPLAGLQGVITPLTLSVVAQGVGQSEVKMSRMVQEVAVPVFEFGIFSNTDLSFFAGADFNFGGRVHANGNLYLDQQTGTLYLGEKVSTAGQVFRTVLENGCSTDGGSGEAGATQTGCQTYTSTVDVDTAPSTYRAMAMTEGSVTGGPGSSTNPNWQTISLTDYNGNIVSATTGGKTLNMALAFSGVSPIEIIERPQATDSSTVSQARLYNQASLIVLLSDNPDELPQIQEADGGPDGPVALDASLILDQPASTTPNTPDLCHAPVAESSGPSTAPGYLGTYGYRNWQGGSSPDLLPQGAPLLGGYLEVLMQDASGTLHNVTQEIVDQGIALPETWQSGSDGIYSGANSCAFNGQTYYPILEMESLPIADADQACQTTTTTTTTGSGRHRTTTTTTTYSCDTLGDTTPTDYVPLSMYDSREGEQQGVTLSTNVPLNGVMGIVQLNVQNLQKWFAGQIGSDSVFGDSGVNALDNGGYIVYFSDERGLRLGGSGGVGQNQTCASNGNCAFYGDDGNIDADVVNGIPDTAYCATGCTTVGDATPSEELFDYTPPGGSNNQNWGAWLQTPSSSLTPWTQVDPTTAEDNPPIFFRRALRLVNGALGSLPPLATADCSSATAGGFSVASENPVYIWGDYNALYNDVNFGTTPATFQDAGGACHVPASVMADAVTLLSDNWNDAESFNSPGNSGGRNASNTAYRMAVLAGISGSFLRTNSTTGHDFGTDGGVHNFLRYLESWGGTLAYDGSLVEMFDSVQATGAFTSDADVYSPPTRAYQFDTDFDSITTLPPGTPRFTDVNALSFQQDLLPGQ